MIDYDSMVKALRLSWLKRIADPKYSSFWKSYLNSILQNKGGLLLLQCNYDMNQIKISVNFLSRTVRMVVKLKRSRRS